MSGIAVKIFWGLAQQLLTQTFVSRVVVHGVQQIAKSTGNELLGNLSRDLADALGVDQAKAPQ